MKISPNGVLVILIIALTACVAGVWALGEFGQCFDRATQFNIEFALYALPFVWLFAAMFFDTDFKKGNNKCD
jgi:hypothetical protein